MVLKSSVFKPVSMMVALCLLSCHDSHFTPIIEPPIDRVQASKISVPKDSEVQDQRIFEPAAQLVVSNRDSLVETPTQPAMPNPVRPHKKKEKIVQLWNPETRPLEVVVNFDISGSVDRSLANLGQRLPAIFSHIHKNSWRMAFLFSNVDNRFAIKNTRTKRNEGLKEGFKQSLGKFITLRPLDDKFSEFKSTRIGKGMTAADQKLVESLPPGENILTNQTPGFERIFQIILSKARHWTGHKRSAVELPLLALNQGFKHSENQFFFHPDTDVLVLTVVDEVHLGFDFPSTSPQVVIDTFNAQLRPLNKRLFAVNILPIDKKCLKESVGEKFFKTHVVSDMLPQDVIDLVELADGGKNISICEPDYGPGLAEVSRHMKAFLRQQIVEIEEDFIPESVKVKVLDGASAITWQLDGHFLVFEDVTEDTRVNISYRFH